MPRPQHIMNWSNLKSGACPKCGEVLKEIGGRIVCFQTCGFNASSERVLEIIRDKSIKKANFIDYDNQADLAALPNPRHL